MQRHANPKPTVDGIVVEDNRVLLVKRLNPPFRGVWALPGGFVETNETVEEAVEREVLEETGLKVKPVKLVGVYSDPKRDPRRHTISTAFLCSRTSGRLKPGTDSGDARWFSLGSLPTLAFDHKKIVADAVKLVKS